MFHFLWCLDRPHCYDTFGQCSFACEICPAPPCGTRSTVSSPGLLFFILSRSSRPGASRSFPFAQCSIAIILALVGCGGGTSPSAPANALPLANAGADQSVDAGATVRLTGSGEDRDGVIAAYRWERVSGPPVDIENPTAASAEFTSPDFEEGNARLVFRLTVTDDDGASAEDEVVITILPPLMQPIYTDGLQLPPNTTVRTPWHLTNVRVTFDRAPDTFESFCSTFRVEGEVGENINLYFSPFNGTINKMQFYGGVQTAISGLDADDHHTDSGRGAIFSRWDERDTAAIMRASGGLIESSGHEGDFIGVRNDFSWDEGRYRLCLRKSERIGGAPLPADFDADDIAFAWGRYEHTWVRMEATDLNADTTIFVGALAIPGRTLALGEDNGLFAEIYGLPSPFPAERVPALTVSVEGFQMDGENLPYRTITTVSNPTPETGREPKMVRIAYDDDDRVLTMELGRFRGRYGKVSWSVFPALSIVESASLVSADGNRFVRAIWDGRALRRNELPRGRMNLRAELTDPAAVESVRLKLEGPVAMERLAEDAPYLLSDAGSGFALRPGNYTLTITPYPGPGGAGTPGPAMTARFSIAAGSSSAVIVSGTLRAHIEAALNSTLTSANEDSLLQRLTRLEVDGGTIDRLDGLEGARNLQVLRLPHHRVSDLSPLMALRHLRVVDLSGNRIRTLAPLVGLAELEELDISHNQVGNLEALASLVGLRSLDVSGNRVDRLAALAGLAELRTLDLSENRVESLVPLVGLTQLRSLDVSGNRVDRLGAVAGLVRLRRLDLSGNRVETVEPLGGLTGLAELDISRNRIRHLAPLSGLLALTHLEASFNRVADLRPLTGLVRLQRLELDNNRIVDIRPLTGLTGLSRLSVGFNRIADLSVLDPLVSDGLQVVGRGEQTSAFFESPMTDTGREDLQNAADRRDGTQCMVFAFNHKFSGHQHCQRRVVDLTLTAL